MRTAICICTLLILALSCGEDAVKPEPPIEPPSETAFDRQVRENCEAVEAAVDSFNTVRGRYPRWLSEFLPLLPGGEFLINPATGEATEPVEALPLALFPSTPGSVGYCVFGAPDPDWNMSVVGYYIVGRGEHCDIVITNVPEIEIRRAREKAVITNCILVAEAAHAFAMDNGGVFSWGSGDVNSEGRRIQSYLPGGTPLMNPYAEIRSEPSWGVAAAGTGSTGYVAIDPDGDGRMDGFSIDGVGLVAGTAIMRIRYPPDGDPPPPEAPVVPCDGKVIRPPTPGFDETVSENCDAVEVAALAYYQANGVYASNRIELLQYLPGGWWLTNPATLVKSEPSGALPRYVGSVGYRLIAEYGAGVIGYYVEGLGEQSVFTRTNIADIDRHLALEREVITNCIAIETAADAFAADNGGVYPAGQYDISRVGMSFQEYLPGGELLENPYTSQRTEPQWNVQAQYPGQAGYAAFDDNRDGLTDWYGIQGVGAMEWGVVYSNTSRSAPAVDYRSVDELVRDNCGIIAAAARVHFDAVGSYPRDPDMVRPYLPRGRLLGNPVTDEFSEPSGSIPDNAGSIGYRLIWEYQSHPVGYYVQGRGELEYFTVTNIADIDRHLALESKVIINCITVGDAADAFARDNLGVFPADENDVNVAGKRVHEYLAGGLALENPYTLQASEPQWGMAASGAGQTGYVAWHDDADGVVDGYTVSGVGAASGVTIFVILDPERRWKPPANTTPAEVSGRR